MANLDNLCEQLSDTLRFIEYFEAGSPEGCEWPGCVHTIKHVYVYEVRNDDGEWERIQLGSCHACLLENRHTGSDIKGDAIHKIRRRAHTKLHQAKRLLSFITGNNVLQWDWSSVAVSGGRYEFEVHTLERHSFVVRQPDRRVALVDVPGEMTDLFNGMARENMGAYDLIRKQLLAAGWREVLLDLVGGITGLDSGRRRLLAPEWKGCEVGTRFRMRKDAERG